jgi:hypothetical protein
MTEQKTNMEGVRSVTQREYFPSSYIKFRLNKTAWQWGLLLAESFAAQRNI